MAQRRSIVVDTGDDAVPVQSTQPTATEPVTHMTLMGYVKWKNLKIDRKSLSGHGKSLVRLSRERKKAFKQLPHDTYGVINAYDVELLDAYFAKVTGK